MYVRTGSTQQTGRKGLGLVHMAGYTK